MIVSMTFLSTHPLRLGLTFLNLACLHDVAECVCKHKTKCRFGRSWVARLTSNWKLFPSSFSRALRFCQPPKVTSVGVCIFLFCLRQTFSTWINSLIFYILPLHFFKHENGREISQFFACSEVVCMEKVFRFFFQTRALEMRDKLNLNGKFTGFLLRRRTMTMEKRQRRFFGAARKGLREN